ncbi:MAG: MFS transporter [Dehalococcoidales bacterium]|nr:MFS transporter [Dehalococcoidales bacterium]
MFYGWYVVFAGLLLAAYSEWTTFYGFTAFVQPVADTFGWSYAQIALATSFRSLVSGTLSPFIGMGVDRWSPKITALTGVIILGAGYFFFSKITSLGTLYLSVILIGIGGGLCHVVPTTTVVRWFRKNVGKAIAILSLSTGLGGLLLPVLVRMIDSYGWQQALVILAIGICVLGIPISFIFRSQPEDYGLLPDGQKQQDLIADSGAAVHDFSLSVREALKTRAFWQMGVAFMLRFPAIMGVLTHIMPYLSSLGVDKATASTVVMIIPLASVGGQLPFGWMADNFQKKYIIASGMMLTVVSMLLFWLIDGSSFWMMVLFAIIFGLGISGFFPLRAPLLRDYFGRGRFATISGLNQLFPMIGTFVGPPLAGWIFDSTGDYGSAWLILGATVVMGVILMLTMPSPSKSPAAPKEAGIETRPRFS